METTTKTAIAIFSTFFALALLSGIAWSAYPSGLVSYWPFDSNANDALGLNNGAVSGATLSSSGGIVKGAYVFNGASSTITVPNSASTNFAQSQSFSIAFFFKCNGSCPASISVLEKWDGATTTYPYLIRFASNSKLSIVIYDGTNTASAQDTSVITDGGWHMAAIVHNAPSKNVSLYIDGVLKNSGTYTTLGTITNSNSTYIGSRSASRYYFNGSIDEIAMFNRSLSASEISDMYANSQYGVKNYFGDCRHACPSFGQGTQNDGASVAANSVFANITLNTVGTLAAFKFYWNGTNNSIYDSSLVAMYNFENSLSDASSYGNAGTFMGGSASYPTGAWGKGLSFNGDSQYVNTSDLLYSNSFTVSAWVNPTSQCQAATTCGIVGKRYAGIDEWRLTLNAGKPALAGWDAAESVIFNTAGVGEVPANSWTHVVAVLNSTNVAMYINGELSNTGSVSGTLLNSVAPIMLGTDMLTAGRYFNGSMDEVRIYNRSLSAGEVRLLYESNLKKISSTSWEFIANQTSLAEGAYAYAGYATDTQGYTDSTGIRSITIASQPSAASYGGETTNFAEVADITNVTSLTLEKTGKGKIKFPQAHSVNAAGADYDSQVVIGDGFISVNSSALHSSFNSTATLTMNLTGVYSDSPAPTIYYYEPFASSLATIISNGQVCAAPRCTGVSWNQATSILAFNVTGFSDYGVNGTTGYGGASNGTASNSTGTLGINITSTNQIAVYTSNGANDSTFSFVPVTPPAAGSITLMSNETANTTDGELGFIVENQGNVNVSITVASDKDASVFIGGSAPLFQMFGGVDEAGACPALNESMQDLSASETTVCPSLAYADSQDAIWAYVLVKIDSDSPPQTNTATLTFTSTQT